MPLDLAQYPSQGLADPIVSTIRRNRELQRLETQKQELIASGDREFQQGVEIAKQRGGDVTGLEGVSKRVGESALSISKQTQPDLPDTERRDAMFDRAEKIDSYQSFQLFSQEFAEEISKSMTPESLEEIGNTWKRRDEEAGVLGAEKLSSQQALTAQRKRVTPDKPMTRTQQLKQDELEEKAVRIDDVGGRSRSLKQAEDYVDELEKKIATKQSAIDKIDFAALDEAGRKESDINRANLNNMIFERNEAIQKINDAREELKVDKKPDEIVNEFNVFYDGLSDKDKGIIDTLKSEGYTDKEIMEEWQR